jgi:hypothetical protein
LVGARFLEDWRIPVAGAKITDVSGEDVDNTFLPFLVLPFTADFFTVDFGGLVSATATLSQTTDSMVALTAASC